MIDQDFNDLIDRLRHRYHGKYRGTVTAVDPDTLKIKAKVPAVLGDHPTGWCLPCVPYAGPGVGFAFLPEVGAAVWIEFEGGDVSYPIWVGCYWRDGERPPDAAPGVKAIVTREHKLLLDDDAKAATLRDSNGNQVALDADGVALSRGGGKVAVADPMVRINDDALEVS
jgi:uncharacterized protein involved in type VI secretion and phage assembly